MPGLVMAGLVALCAAGPASARSWDYHYERGLSLLRRERWAEAEAELREALARRPESECLVRVYGARFRTYLPHYRLALALEQQGRGAEAAVEFSRELAAGVLDACPDAVAEAKQAHARLESLALAESVEPPPSEPPEVVAPTEPPASGAAGNRPPRPVAPAPSAAPGPGAAAAGVPDAQGGVESAPARASSGAALRPRATPPAQPAGASAAAGPAGPSAEAPQRPSSVARPPVRPLLGVAWSRALAGLPTLLPPVGAP